jgi:hypothetical protein
MRAFAEKPKATQQAKSAKSAVPGRADFERGGMANFALHLQRTIGNQAVQRLIEASTANALNQYDEPGMYTLTHRANGEYTGADMRGFGSIAEAQAKLDIPIHPPVAHDAAAGDIAAAARARAVTVGSRIYIAPSEYNPGSTRGRELIAHEQVHVAQQRLGTSTGEGSVAAAEAEARQLAPVIARAGWANVRVTQPAAPVMRDRYPDEDLSDDRDVIRNTLEARYPYLAMLSNHKQIEHEFVERIAYEKQSTATQRAISALPNPAGTFLSDEIDKRKRALEPYYRRLRKQVEARDKYLTSIQIDPMELVSATMWAEAKKFTGVAAMLKLLKRYRARVRVERMGFDSFRYGLSLSLDGAWLPIEDDGLHSESFFRPGLVVPMIYFQQAFYHGTSEDLHELMQRWVELDPSVGEQQLDEFIAEQDALALGRPDRPLTPEEQEIETYQTANKQYAEAVRQKTEAAVQPLIMIASFFEIDGPVDLLLTVVPVDKLAGKLFKVGREALAARRARKLEQALIKEFEGLLDKEAKAFFKLAQSMSKTEVRALKTIQNAVNSPALIESLMNRSIAGTANLAWIAKKLEKGHIDGNFVRAFTHAESGLEWKVFEDIVERRKVHPDVRKGFASQIKGLLGEEAAYKLVRTEGFAQKVLGGRAGAKLKKIWREIPYGGPKSLDLFAETDKAELIAGEVKHWNTKTWLSKQNDLLDQLERHNKGIDDVARAMSHKISDVKKKILFVSKEGFTGLTEATQAKLITGIGKKGWTLQFIEDASIESFDELIDRMR